MSKTALVCGITGQDGALLAKFLLSKGYSVVGQTRSFQKGKERVLETVGVFSQVELKTCSLLDTKAVQNLLSTVAPDEIYNLSGQSSVGLSFSDPVGTFQSHAVATLNILEAIRLSGLNLRFFNAGSGEIFGDSDAAIDINMPLNPRSPYGVAKSAAYMSVENYRDVYGLYACTGILFNHESPYRSENFVTKKIVKTACRIAQGSDEKLMLGNINVLRDWGWAEEYVEAMWLMLQQESPKDYVIATGERNSLKDFVRVVFETLDLNWTDHVVLSDEFKRASEIHSSYGNTHSAEEELGWKATIKMKNVVQKLVGCELK